MKDSKNDSSTSTEAGAEPEQVSADLLTNADKAHFHAHKLLYYKNLIVEQCDGWLSAEEGMRNQLRTKRINNHRII
jgi:hypothetical protein